MNYRKLQQATHQRTQASRACIHLIKHMNLTALKQHFLVIAYTVFFLGFFFFPSSKSHDNFFYIAVAFPFLILIFMKKVALRSFFSSRIFLLSTIFLVYMFSTLFWSDTYQPSDISKYGRRVLYVLIFLGVTIHLVQTYPHFIQRMLELLCWTAAIFAVGYIVFYYSQHPFPQSRLYGFGQLSNPIMASSVYGIASIACIYLFQQQHTVKTKLLYLGVSIVLFLYILLTQSRGPLLAWGITIFGWTILESFPHGKGEGRYHHKLRLVLLLICALGIVLFIRYPDFFKSRIFRSNVPRLEIWEQSLSQAKNKPYFGHGLNADTRVILSGSKIKNRLMLHHHSVYMTTLFYGGVVGLFLLIALIGLAIRQGLTRTVKLQKFLLTCMLLFGALCIVTDGNTLLRHPKPVWIFFWFPVALIAASELPGHSLSSEKQTEKGLANKLSAPE
jgi:O-antigen ligase